MYVKRLAWKNAGCELLATRTYALRRTLQPCAIHLGMRTGKKNGTPSLAKQNFDGDVCFVQRRQLYEWNEAWRKRFVLETNLRTTTFQRSNNHLNLQQMQGTNRALFHTRHKDTSCTYCQVTQNESCVKAQAPEVSIN